LTTPIRPPRVLQHSTRIDGDQPRDLCRGPLHLATRRPPTLGNDPCVRTQRFSARRPQFRKGPHSWRMRIFCATTPLTWLSLLYVTNHRIVKEHRDEQGNTSRRSSRACFPIHPGWPLARGWGRPFFVQGLPHPAPSGAGSSVESDSRFSRTFVGGRRKPLW